MVDIARIRETSITHTEEKWVHAILYKYYVLLSLQHNILQNYKIN